MSHGKIRKETDCLNCGAEVMGPYCHKCGQENIEPHETFLGMVRHFFYDITHFEGSFFTTLKTLVLKPGFLSKEYIRGRRNAYLHPIRMYVFTSAVFFLVFFSLYSVKESDIAMLDSRPDIQDAVRGLKSELEKDSLSGSDSVLMKKLDQFLLFSDSLNATAKNDSSITKATRGSKSLSLDFGDATNYQTVEEYDSVQSALPAGKRDNWFERSLNRKLIAVQKKYKGNESKLLSDLVNKFFHTFPYLLFVSLPLYALFLKMLYFRRKKYFYADHGIFLIHLYIFTFIFLLMFILFNRLSEYAEADIYKILELLFFAAGLFYTLKAFRNFYEQRWGRTIFKFLIFNLACFVALIALFGIFLFLSVLQI